MSTLLQDIEEQISGVKTTTARQNVGTVREIGDGVAKVEGLSRAKLNEMLDFGNGVIGTERDGSHAAPTLRSVGFGCQGSPTGGVRQPTGTLCASGRSLSERLAGGGP